MYDYEFGSDHTNFTMRLLWITNVELPEIAKYYKRETVLGGWMDSMARQLAAIKTIDLHVICPLVKEKYVSTQVNGIAYSNFLQEDAENEILNLIRQYNPDIVHIWGTEYPHALAAINAVTRAKLLGRTVVSIQGLVSFIAQHYTAGLPEKIVNHRTIKEMLGRPNLNDSRREMERLGKREREVLQKAKHCIGRTDWDYACVKQMNPKIHYHFCNETLRAVFYESVWNYENCEKNTIFFSQAHYPLKGLHHMLQALVIVRQYYPSVKLRVVGKDYFNYNSIVDKMKLSTYQKYIIKYVKEYNLMQNIEWVGTLDAEQMKNQYCKANVFVCASSIENSSNSVGEAMLLGMPVVASDVGGIKSYMQHEKEGILYQESAPYMLADGIMRFFSDKEYAKKTGENARKRAMATHNEAKNLDTLLNIYAYLMENQENAR